MSDVGKPLFLERESYKRRRVIDASRLTPLLGAFLFLIPLAWPDRGASGEPVLANIGLYMFAVWFFLVVCAAFVARRLSRDDWRPDAPATEDQETEAG